MANVKVKMLVNTAYQGPRKEGDVISVPDDFANRWVKNGIAAYIEGPDEEPENDVSEEEVTTDEVIEDEGENEEDAYSGDVDADVDYENMNAKELYALCKEQGIDVASKKSKEYYIEQLSK